MFNIFVSVTCSDGLPYEGGCWIGLRDRYGVGLYQWIEPNGMNDVSFRDWRRTEELNRDMTAGFLDNGKRCVHTFPWQEDPAIEEQGSWSLSPCATKRSFVCQHAARTHNIVLEVTGRAVFSGGAEVFGGSLRLQVAEVVSLKATHASEIIIYGASNESSLDNGGVNVLRTMLLSDGSALRLRGPGDFFGVGNVFIGELDLAGLQPVIDIGSDVNLYFFPDDDIGQSSVESSSSNSTAMLAARVDSYHGRVYVAAGVSLDFGQVIL